MSGHRFRVNPKFKPPSIICNYKLYPQYLRDMRLGLSIAVPNTRRWRKLYCSKISLLQDHRYRLACLRKTKTIKVPVRKTQTPSRNKFALAAYVRKIRKIQGKSPFSQPRRKLCCFTKRDVS